MKVYFEFIFIINFLLDFMILYGTKRILKRNNGILRMLLSSAFGSLTTFLLLINIESLELFLLKLLISIGMIIISFGFSDFIHNFLYFYFISIILGGFIYLFDFDTNYYFHFFFLIIGSCFVIYLLIKEFLHYKEKFINKFIVSICYKKKWYQLEGFIDTGNRLISPIKKEVVILVNLKLESSSFIYVPYKALNTTGIIPCIRPDMVLINNIEFHNCLIGLANDKFSLNGLNCILPNKFKEELC